MPHRYTGKILHVDLASLAVEVEEPEKMFKKALKGGRTDGVSVDWGEWQEMMDHYYRLSGWDMKSGNPGREKLESLGLGGIK